VNENPNIDAAHASSIPRPARLSRPHILFLSQCLPYPPDSGVTSRTFNVVTQLQREFDVTLVPFFRKNHQPDAATRENSARVLAQLLSRVCEPVPITAEHSITRRAWDHFRSVCTGRAYTFYEYSSSDFQRKLQDALRKPPDLIHLDSLDLHRWLPEIPAAPTTCTHHDIDSELLRRRATRVNSQVVRRYVLHQASLIERTMREYCPKFTLNVLMSQVDATMLQHLAPGSRTAVVPNGVDTEYFEPLKGSERPGRVVFIGSPLGFPNRDALEYLLDDIWPQLAFANPRATLEVIGRCSRKDRARYESHAAVRCVGYIPDMRAHVAEACCCVVPIRVGGGTRVKILDAWAMGKPVVSTSIGCEGLEVIEGRNILIRDTPGGFAAAIRQVLSDPELQMWLGNNGRKTVETYYSWKAIGRRLRDEYRTILA
jgi:glycosyltransferase involved in cell wall biosynthesis